MSERDEMRRLIDVIEKGAASASVEQNFEDFKLFANVASFLTNKIDAKIKGGKSVKAKQSSTPKLRIPKPKVQTSEAAQQQQTSASALPLATSVATSSADFEKLKRGGHFDFGIQEQASRLLANGFLADFLIGTGGKKANRT